MMAPSEQQVPPVCPYCHHRLTERRTVGATKPDRLGVILLVCPNGHEFAWKTAGPVVPLDQ